MKCSECDKEFGTTKNSIGMLVRHYRWKHNGGTRLSAYDVRELKRRIKHESDTR